MAVAGECKVSPSSKYFSYSSPDGSLKLWNTTSGLLEHQFTPSSHLSASCTCLSWGKSTSNLEKIKKNKKKKLSHDVCQGHENLIAMGTLSGSVLVYNVAKADLETQLDGGHSSKVNDVCWNQNSLELFSCGNDGYIVHWSVKDGKVLSKWNSDDTQSMHSIALIASNYLLTASRTIFWWDLSTKSIIKKFTGHATEVNLLMPVTFTKEEAGENCYSLSSAVNDRIINVWKMNMEESSRSALGMLSVNEEVKSCSVSNSDSKSEPIFVFVITKSGVLKVFEHQLNGKCKKPLKSKIDIQIASESENGLRSAPISILNAKYINKEEFLIVYGNFIKPTFERLKFEDCTRRTFLVRAHPSISSVSINTSESKIMVPEVRSSAKVLTPGLMNPSQPSDDSSKSKKQKRKVVENSVSEMPIEERLNDIRIRRNSASSEQVPQTDNLAHLLAQGLQSNDSQMLNSVLQKSGSSEIQNTIRKLPVQYIVPLITELKKRISGRSQSNHPYIKWIISVFVNHTSYFATNHDAVRLLQPLNDLFDSKLDRFQHISRLAGRFELILSQIALRQQAHSDIPTEPLLLYQEDSPEEDDDEDIMKPVHSESEDNWDELSDLENMNQIDEDEADELSDDEMDMT